MDPESRVRATLDPNPDKHTFQQIMEACDVLGIGDKPRVKLRQLYAIRAGHFIQPYDINTLASDIHVSYWAIFEGYLGHQNQYAGHNASQEEVEYAAMVRGLWYEGEALMASANAKLGKLVRLAAERYLGTPNTKKYPKQVKSEDPGDPLTEPIVPSAESGQLLLDSGVARA